MICIESNYDFKFSTIYSQLLNPHHKNMKRRNTVGLYGGSFNPIHIGHIGLARQILSLNLVDEVWFSVSPQNPLKQNAFLLDDEKRLSIVRHALEGEPRMIATDYEFHLPKPSYTWNTLHSLQADYPDTEFVLIIGADNWACIDRWSHGLEIAHHYPIIVYPRKGDTIDSSTLPPNVTLLNTPMIDVSSTEIRSLIANGHPITGLVPASIEKEIEERYGKQPL